jgi:hypothetical protein
MLARVMLAIGVAVVALAAVAGCGGDDKGDVAFSEVQDVFAKYGCASCHPGVNPALDLRPEHAYGDLVGVKALADPTLCASVGPRRRTALQGRIFRADWPGRPPPRPRCKISSTPAPVCPRPVSPPTTG